MMPLSSYFLEVFFRLGIILQNDRSVIIKMFSISLEMIMEMILYNLYSSEIREFVRLEKDSLVWQKIKT